MTHSRVRAVGVVAAAVLVAGAPLLAEGADPPDFEALARTLEEARRALDVPGMSVAIVHDGEMVFARGFGERALGSGEGVDERTLFAIGSATKAFTAAGVAMLVDAGEVAWGNRVTEHLPSLRLHEPYPTAELRVADMLSHRSGLPRGDMLWYGSGVGREEILERLPELEPASSFRSAFGYQNIMYLAAGEMIEAVSGAGWDEWIATRIFDPLGMRESNTTISALSGKQNVASPHAEVDERIVTVPWRNIDNMAPAGSINSNAADMARWVAMLLDEGEIGEGEGARSLLTPGSIEVMWTPHSIATPTGPAGALRAESHFLLYGLGWFLQDYRGEKVVQHGGNIDGMSALVAMIPQRELGVVVLTNLNGSVLPAAIVNEVFDAFLGVDDHDWSSEAKEVADIARRAGTQSMAQLRSTRIEGTSPTLPLGAYAGTYRHDFYGECTVEHEGEALIFRRGELTADAEHWHYDTFELKNRAKHPPLGTITFRLGADGKVGEATLFGEDEWRRVPATPSADPTIELSEEQMRRYTGTYLHKALGIQAHVFVQGGALRAQIPGQPSFEMLPTGEHAFSLGGLPAQISVDMVFSFEGEGGARALTFTQTPGGTFELLRQEE